MPSSRIDPNSSTSIWGGVGGIKVPSGSYSGVLIDRRFVLTAAHVVEGQSPASTWFVLNMDDGGGMYLAVRAIHRHPKYQGFNPPFAFHDLALLELAQPVPQVTPIYDMSFDPLKAEAALTFVGYGASGSGAEGPNVDANPTVKRVGRNHADRLVSSSDAPNSPAIFLFDFDGPGVPSVMGSHKMANSEETSPATGDSGAPAFVGEGASRKLVGLVTFVNDPKRSGIAKGRFGSTAGGVLLGPSKSWILKTIGR